MDFHFFFFFERENVERKYIVLAEKGLFFIENYAPVVHVPLKYVEKRRHALKLMPTVS